MHTSHQVTAPANWRSQSALKAQILHDSDSDSDQLFHSDSNGIRQRHLYVCMHVYAYVCMYAYMHVCIYVCMYIYGGLNGIRQCHLHVCMHDSCMYVCMHICMYVSMYVCMFMEV